MIRQIKTRTGIREVEIVMRELKSTVVDPRQPAVVQKGHPFSSWAARVQRVRAARERYKVQREMV